MLRTCYTDDGAGLSGSLPEVMFSDRDKGAETNDGCGVQSHLRQQPQGEHDDTADRARHHVNAQSVCRTALSKVS